MSSIDQAREAETSLYIEKIVDRVRNEMGVDHIAFGYLDQSTKTASSVATYSSEWKKFYFEEGLVSYDPAVVTAYGSVAPVDWRRLKGLEGYNEVFGPAQDFGVPGQGLSLQVRGFLGSSCLFAVSARMKDREWDSFIASKMAELQAQAAFIADAVTSELEPLGKTLRPSLSMIEREALDLFARGLVQEQIAEILRIDTLVTKVALRSCCEKLGVSTLPQAVGRAMRLSMIEPIGI